MPIGAEPVESKSQKKKREQLKEWNDIYRHHPCIFHICVRRISALGGFLVNWTDAATTLGHASSFCPRRQSHYPFWIPHGQFLPFRCDQRRWSSASSAYQCPRG